VKEAKNFILLIGDGMGYYQTKLFEYMEVTCDFSDGEDVFYGYMLPYIGSSRTASLSGITDSAAGGTALSCGIKTYNEYLGRDRDFNDVKNMTELAHELGKSAAVMSTETQKGATPSSFVVHANDRDDTASIIDGHIQATLKYGTIITCGFDYYTANYMKKVIDKQINETLDAVSKNENGFFLMYEEAYIDKHCHDNDMEKTFEALIRFNQAIARFMEFAFYNPDTFVLITADHETGRLLPNESGMLQYNYDDHSEADVPVFAYGCGAELFDGITVENIQIAHTIAALMGEENFGDQSVYQSLTK
jgi:alkaline phosphatase